jgi:predicted enzyme related to lactoylglutathione lyase
MIHKIDTINLFSENPKPLAEFYGKTVGLGQPEEAELGEEGSELFWWEMEGCSFAILKHSKVSGKNPNPERMMINFEVKDINEGVERLDNAGVRKIQDTYHIENYGYIATFEDLDGNYFQLVQVRATDDNNEHDHEHHHEHNHNHN